jgi:hypothetical protein
MYRSAAPSNDAVAGAAGDSAVAHGILFTSLSRLVGIMSRARSEIPANQDDVVTIETAGLAQIGRPSVVRPDSIDHGVVLLPVAIGGLRR